MEREFECQSYIRHSGNLAMFVKYEPESINFWLFGFTSIFVNFKHGSNKIPCWTSKYTRTLFLTKLRSLKQCRNDNITNTAWQNGFDDFCLRPIQISIEFINTTSNENDGASIDGDARSEKEKMVNSSQTLCLA